MRKRWKWFLCFHFALGGNGSRISGGKSPCERRPNNDLSGICRVIHGGTVNPRSLCMSLCRPSFDQKRQITFGMKKFLCLGSESMGIKQSRSGRISTTQLANAGPFWDGVFLPLGGPASAGLFRTPALPKLNRSPSEAPVSQSNCWLLIAGGQHLLRIIFVFSLQGQSIPPRRVRLTAEAG